MIQRLLASLFKSFTVPQSEQDRLRAMSMLFGLFIFDDTLSFPFSSSFLPLAWYFYQYHRILQYGEPPESRQKPFFWMFVDNLVLEKEDRDTASRFFKVHRKSNPSPDGFFFTSCLVTGSFYSEVYFVFWECFLRFHTRTDSWLLNLSLPGLLVCNKGSLSTVPLVKTNLTSFD